MKSMLRVRVTSQTTEKNLYIEQQWRGSNILEGKRHRENKNTLVLDVEKQAACDNINIVMCLNDQR